MIVAPSSAPGCTPYVAVHPILQNTQHDRRSVENVSAPRTSLPILPARRGEFENRNHHTSILLGNCSLLLLTAATGRTNVLQVVHLHGTSLKNGNQAFLSQTRGTALKLPTRLAIQVPSGHIAVLISGLGGTRKVSPTCSAACCLLSSPMKHQASPSDKTSNKSC